MTQQGKTQLQVPRRTMSRTSDNGTSLQCASKACVVRAYHWHVQKDTATTRVLAALVIRLNAGYVIHLRCYVALHLRNTEISSTATLSQGASTPFNHG